MDSKPAEERLPWLALLAGLGGILIFVGILAIAYIPDNEQLVQNRLSDDRAQGVRQTGKELDVMLESYGWINEAEGVAHIPIERAMDLRVARARETTPED